MKAAPDHGQRAEPGRDWSLGADDHGFTKSGQFATAIVVGLFQALHADAAERLEVFWPNDIDPHG